MVTTVLAVRELIKSSSLKEAQKVPETLPLSVQRMVASAVKVYYNEDLPIGDEGSGVKVGPDLVLTAGHVALDDNPNKVLECKGSFTSNKYTSILSYTDLIVDVWATNNSAIDTVGQDMGLLRVSPDQAFDALPTARIAASQPAKGETAFFVNYEDENDGNGNSEYYPNSATAQYAAGHNYGHPAEYAGTILGYQGPFW